jgi:hypothetical protein
MADMTISNAYYKLNADNKIELYFEGREAYSSLDDAVKSDIKRSFVWGRRRKAWVSRTKGVGIPYQMDKYNIPFEGADDLSKFSDTQERKYERLENKADRLESRANTKDKKAESLQAEFNRLRGDWSWITQPNIASSSGRAFTRSRDKTFSRYEKGMEMSINADKMREAAESARGRASKAELSSESYLINRVKDGEKAVKKFKEFETRYGEKLNSLDSQTSQNQAWLMARLRSYELEFEKLAYFKYHLDILQGLKQDAGRETLDDIKSRMKGLKKEVKTYFKEAYNIDLVRMSKSYGTGERTAYAVRVKDNQELPKIYQTGYAAKYVAQPYYRNLVDGIDKWNESKKAKVVPEQSKPETKLTAYVNPENISEANLDPAAYIRWKALVTKIFMGALQVDETEAHKLLEDKDNIVSEAFG